MCAISQFRSRESDATSTADSELPIAAPASGGDDLLQLLRETIARLNSSNGELPDQAQVANVLAEVREALERANVIARAVAQCEEFLRETQFNKASQALDAGLGVYPADPALVRRRREVEEQQRAFHAAGAVRTALAESQWLVDQDRPDLAAHALKEKAAELPDQPALIFRLEEIDALLPQWEQNRHVRTALGRAAALEQLQQWQVAVTVIEEALQRYPASEELIGAARRARDRLADRDRQKKLARRLELIGQKIDEQCWSQALALLEITRKEFPGLPEVNPLRHKVDAGLRRSECEAIVTEVRQCLVDGEPEQAEQALRRGLESLGQEPALDALREELESERKYREELRTAQIHFGRHQLQEAEHVLTQLVAQDRPEAKALLDAVREARAASEEQDFCERGREKALKLMQQQQFAQAVDLLRNLLSLFPGNSILERDLIAAQNELNHELNHELNQGSSEVPPATGEENREPQVPVTPAATRETASSRVRRAAIAGTASLVLVSASGAAWRLSHNDTPPLPPGTGAIVSVRTIPGLPGESAKSVNDPAPPPAAPTEPQLIDRTLPVYPALARQRGIFGAVRMEALVDEYGAVKNVTIVSGDPILAAAARTAVLKWKYKAATLNGQPIAISVTIQVLFGGRNK